MQVSQIITLLAELDKEEQRPYIQAISLEHRGGGGCGAWNCRAENGLTYVVKSQNNPQDRPYGRPWKVLTTELICGKLGQLFKPTVCPPVSVIDIPYKLASVNLYPYNNNESVVAGPSFGSQLASGMIETKAGGRIELVPLEQIARIMVYQTWLRGEDVAALISLDGRNSLSIDHGWYLTGSRWDEAVFSLPLTVLPVQIPQFQQQGNVIDSQLFRKSLDELMNLPEMDIIKAFSSIPMEWGASLEFRAKLADFVLRRRSLVEKAVSTIWRGAVI